MMNAPLSFQQMEGETLQTSRMLVVTRYVSAIDIFLIGNGTGHKNDRVLLGVRDSFVYHPGAHMCSPKPNTKKYRSLIKEAFLRNVYIVV